MFLPVMNVKLKAMNGLKFILASAMLSVIPGKAGWMDQREINHSFQTDMPYRVGEEITYRVHYGLMNAGLATIRVEEKANVLGQETYHMVGEGHSVGMVDWFFPTKDRYETYIDHESLLPVRFIRDVNEGGFIIKRDVIFDRQANQATDYRLDAKKEFEWHNFSQHSQSLG